MNELTNTRKRYIQAAATYCTQSIDMMYDQYARENIENKRTNLETGNPFTDADIVTMNSFIDAKRSQYAQVKQEILTAQTEEEIHAVNIKIFLQ